MRKTSAATVRTSAKKSRTAPERPVGRVVGPALAAPDRSPVKEERTIGSDMERVDRHIITREEYEEIPELHEDWLVPVEIDEASGRILKRGGRPRKPDAKVQVSLRLRPATLQHFKSLGKGWQQRIEDILNAVVSVEQDAAERKVAEARREAGGHAEAATGESGGRPQAEPARPAPDRPKARETRKRRTA